MVSRVPWEGLRVTWGGQLKGTLATCLHLGADLRSLSGPGTHGASTDSSLLREEGSCLEPQDVPRGPSLEQHGQGRVRSWGIW